MKIPYNVGVGIGVFVCRKGKVLMLHRAGAHGAGTWAPPGGKMDHGEDPIETAIREVKEETDLDIQNPAYIGFTNDIFESDGLHYITLWYVTNEANGTEKITESNKCIDQKWFDPDSPPDPLFIPTDHILKDDAAMKIIHKYLKEQKL